MGDFLDLFSDGPTLSVEDKIWYNKIESSVRFAMNRFEIAIPFREPPKTEGSYSMTLKRFQDLEKKFRKDEIFFQEFKQFMDQMIHSGHARESRDDEAVRGDFRLF